MSSPKSSDDPTAAIRALTQAVRDLTKQLRSTTNQFAAFAVSVNEQFREGESGWGFGDEEQP